MTIKFMEHTADVKFQASGSSLEEAFSEAVVALRQSIVGDMKINNEIEKEFEVSGKDNEALLYNFLEEFLFFLDAEDFLVSEVKEISIEKNKLKTVVVGDKASNYDFTNDVKAVTYNDMFVKERSKSDLKSDEKQSGGKFICQVVLDV